MSKLIVIEPEEFVFLLSTEIKKATAPLEKAIKDLESRDDMIGQEEAKRILKISAKSRFYDWIKEGWIINYGEGRKPLYSKRECETARFRKKQKASYN